VMPQNNETVAEFRAAPGDRDGEFVGAEFAVSGGE